MRTSDLLEKKFERERLVEIENLKQKNAKLFEDIDQLNSLAPDGARIDKEVVLRILMMRSTQENRILLHGRW